MKAETGRERSGQSGNSGAGPIPSCNPSPFLGGNHSHAPERRDEEEGATPDRQGFSWGGGRVG